jgi:hypothetical protein
MALRESAALSGGAAELSALIEGRDAGDSGVEEGGLLLRFADASVGDDEEELAAARSELLAAMGGAAVVDAAAVAANFQRMVRIADATGIPIDTPMEMMSRDIRVSLDLSRFEGASSTPSPGLVRRVLAPLMRRVVRGVLRVASARQRAREATR